MKPQQSIDLVIFDLAGTTVYDGDAVNGCFRAALGAAGFNVDAAVVQTVMGLPKPEAIRRLIGSSEQVDTIHADFVARMRRFYAEDPGVREVPGAAAVFAVLRQAGIKVAVNTGFNRAVTTVLFDRLGWHQAIDASVTSDEVARGRPFSDMVLALMKRCGVPDPTRVAKVGDTPVDLEEGFNAGCGLNIGVTTGGCSEADLERCPHTHILRSVTELPRLLGIDWQPARE